MTPDVRRIVPSSEVSRTVVVRSGAGEAVVRFG